MGKRILILDGSPRKKGNTDLLVEAFTEGAMEKGHEVTTYYIREMNIKPCLGCYGGGKDKKSPCVQKDDMEPIYSAFEAADVIVWASPLYYWTFSAQLKIVIDRLFAVMEAHKYESPFKESVLLVAAGDDTKDNFKLMVEYYEYLLTRLKWKDRGKVLAGGVTMIGDMIGKPFLEEAKQLGASI